MFRIRLSEKDRKRFGCPEWLTVDVDSMTAREAAIIQTEGGIAPDEISDELIGQPVFDNGAPVFQRDIVTGEVIRDDGIPRQKRRYNFNAWLALVWLALRRNGIQVPYAEMDFDLSLDVEPVKSADELGKDAGTPSSASIS